MAEAQPLLLRRSDFEAYARVPPRPAQGERPDPPARAWSPDRAPAALGAEAIIDKEKITASWEALANKSLESLTGMLKEHKYGCGKWMVRRHGQRALVVPQLSIQAAWDVGFGSGLGCSTHCRGALLQLRSPPPVHLPCGHQRAPAPLTRPL